MNGRRLDAILGEDAFQSLDTIHKDQAIKTFNQTHDFLKFVDQFQPQIQEAKDFIQLIRQDKWAYRHAPTLGCWYDDIVSSPIREEQAYKLDYDPKVFIRICNDEDGNAYISRVAIGQGIGGEILPAMLVYFYLDALGATPKRDWLRSLEGIRSRCAEVGYGRNYNKWIDGVKMIVEELPESDSPMLTYKVENHSPFIEALDIFLQESSWANVVSGWVEKLNDVCIDETDEIRLKTLLDRRLKDSPKVLVDRAQTQFKDGFVPEA